MFQANKSIMISNVLDPLSKDPVLSKEMYARLFQEGRYTAFETRTIRDEELLSFFNTHKPDHLSVTFGINGELSRNHLSLCTTDEKRRRRSIEYVINTLETAEKTNADYICLASGETEENTLANLDAFIDSLTEIFNYIRRNGLPTHICIEPLDQYAHKKNTIGSLDMTLRMIRKLEDRGYDEKDYILAFDCAHHALNEDDFEEGIRLLDRYIYKLHFADAVLDKKSSLYGDRHLNIGTGFLNEDKAREIFELARKYIDHPVDFTVEVRESDVHNVWNKEEETYRFLCAIIKE